MKQAMSFQSLARSSLRVRTSVIASLTAEPMAGSWKPAARTKESARSNKMSKTIRNYAALAAVVLMTGVMGFAQAGEATYKAKCQSCHGADGNPNPGIAKMMGVKPASDATVKAHSEDEMLAVSTNGKNKMPAFKGKLSDDEIKGSVEYFRTFAK